MPKNKFNYELRLGWLYPELMSTYGDRGNIIVLKKRCLSRNINLIIQNIDYKTTVKELEKCDLIFGGGAQDRQQSLVMQDLLKNKSEILRSMFANETPGLFVCGSPQLLGNYYVNSLGQKLDGLGVFDMVTRSPGAGSARLIGNLVCEINDTYKVPGIPFKHTVVGFENHGGRTFLGEGVEPFAKVISGFGNNGTDKTEGARYKNCLATYMHGPFLPKNPHIADWLIYNALLQKGHIDESLLKLDDTLEWKAHEYMVNRYP